MGNNGLSGWYFAQDSQGIVSKMSMYRPEPEAPPPEGALQGVSSWSGGLMSMGQPSLPGTSSVQGLQPPMGDSGTRSDCVATMDMLNDMFQRQARRLESQLYQRAQDARTIETVQKQAQETMVQVRSLERYHVEQAARITQSTKAMEELQQQMRAASREHDVVLSTCEVLQEDADQLRRSLEQQSPQCLEEIELAGSSIPSIAILRERASQLEANVAEAELRASMHIGITPSTMSMMSSSCNPLHDLSAVADYAQRELASSPAYPPRS